MRPVLFHVGPVAVPTHETFVMLGVLASLVVTLLGARGRLDERLGWVVVGALLGGAVAAPLGNLLWAKLAIAPEQPLEHLAATAGRSILGGLAGAYAGAVLAKRLAGYRRRTGDLFAPAVALGMAVGRIGCFLTEQIGTPTSLPWGISVEAPTAARIPACPGCLAGVPMHPSFLYEIGFHAIAFVVLLRVRGRPHPEGELLTGYLLAYGLFRFAVEFVRGNHVVLAGLTGSQLFLLLTVPIVAVVLVRRWSDWQDPALPAAAT